MHKAIEDVEERLVIDVFNLEGDFYSRTDKFENALKKKGFFSKFIGGHLRRDEIMKEDSFYDSFMDELIDNATPLIGNFVKNNEKVTYTNIFKYQREFADYIAECFLDGRLVLTKPKTSPPAKHSKVMYDRNASPPARFFKTSSETLNQIYLEHKSFSYK